MLHASSSELSLDDREMTSVPPPGRPARGHRRSQVSNRARGRLIDLFAWLHNLAESGWSRSAVAGYAFLVSSVVPGPSEVLLASLGIADPPKAFKLAWWSVVGSVLGGLVAYGIGALAFGEVAPYLDQFGVLSAGQVEALRGQFRTRGWLVVIIGTLPFGSPKLVSIAAGALGLPLLQFIFPLSVIRIVRYMSLAALVHLAGDRPTRWLERRIGRPLFPAPADAADDAPRREGR